MSNCETRDELVNLWEKLSSLDYVAGFLCTNHSNTVSYPSHPEETKRIQAELNKVSDFINVIYFCAIIDEAGFKPSNRWISPDDKKELEAWLHIRHTGAHVPNSRAHRFKEEFNSFMTSEVAGNSGLKQNCTWDDNSINLIHGVSYNFYTFINTVVKKALSNCLSPTYQSA